jgi:thioesterase domain-containing protein
MNTRIPLLEIFKRPTIKKLGEYIREEQKEVNAVADDDLVLLKSESEKANNLFFIHNGTGEVEVYIDFCNHLNDAFNCWGIKAERLKNYTPVNLTIEELARGYIGKLKRVQPHGPYYIAGWSIGGTIAFEMIRQLEQMDEKIAAFGLIDSPPPGGYLKKYIQQFTLESELDRLHEDFPHIEIKEISSNIAGIEHFWPNIVYYLEKRKIDVEIVRKMVKAYGGQALPNYHSLSIGEAIYYINVFRSLISAGAKYYPAQKINTPIHYFAASQSKGIKFNYWKNFAHKGVEFYVIKGDHYSIFRMPQVADFARIFSNVLIKK